MEDNNTPTNVAKTQKINIGNYRKADDILTNDRLIKLYALLPDKESKLDFLETLLDDYEVRLEEKFGERLAEEFEADASEISQGHLKENIKNKRSIVDIIRSRRRKPLREGVTERVNYLVQQMQQGNYITKEDMKFLSNHLALPAHGGIKGKRPSERREQVENIIENYMSSRLSELENTANKYSNRNKIESRKNYLVKRNIDLARDIEKKQTTISNISGCYECNPDEDKDIAREKRIIEAFEKEIIRNKGELQELEGISKNQESLNSMLHPNASEEGTERNTEELEKLMEILDAECAELTKKGVKLPQTGINSDEVVELEVDETVEEPDKKKEAPQPSAIKTPNEIKVEKEAPTINSQDNTNTNVITPEEIEEVVMIDPRALKVLKEAADTKELVAAQPTQEKGRDAI